MRCVWYYKTSIDHVYITEAVPYGYETCGWHCEFVNESILAHMFMDESAML